MDWPFGKRLTTWFRRMTGHEPSGAEFPEQHPAQIIPLSKRMAPPNFVPMPDELLKHAIKPIAHLEQSEHLYMKWYWLSKFLKTQRINRLMKELEKQKNAVYDDVQLAIEEIYKCCVRRRLETNIPIPWKAMEALEQNIGLLATISNHFLKRPIPSNITHLPFESATYKASGIPSSSIDRSNPAFTKLLKPTLKDHEIAQILQEIHDSVSKNLVTFFAAYRLRFPSVSDDENDIEIPCKLLARLVEPVLKERGLKPDDYRSVSIAWEILGDYIEIKNVGGGPPEESIKTQKAFRAIAESIKKMAPGAHGIRVAPDVFSHLLTAATILDSSSTTRHETFVFHYWGWKKERLPESERIRLENHEEGQHILMETRFSFEDNKESLLAIRKDQDKPGLEKQQLDL